MSNLCSEKTKNTWINVTEKFDNDNSKERYNSQSSTNCRKLDHLHSFEFYFENYLFFLWREREDLLEERKLRCEERVDLRRTILGSFCFSDIFRRFFSNFGPPVRGDMRYAQTATVLSFIWRTLSHCLYFSDHKGCPNCKKMITSGKRQMTSFRDINYSNSTLTGVKLTDNF